jgi:hypothetical protein
MKGASFLVWLVKPSCKRSSIVGCDVEVPPRARESTSATDAREAGGEIFTRKILYGVKNTHLLFAYIHLFCVMAWSAFRFIYVKS